MTRAFRRFKLLRAGSIVLFGILVVVSLIVLRHAAGSATGVKDDEVVAAVDGEPITYGELRMHMERERSRVVQYFYEKYGATDRKNYWYAEFGGERPIDKLISAAMEQVYAVKIQQMLARELGVVERIDYPFFRLAWQQENERRSRAVARKEVVYGPVRYDESGYYAYLFNNMVIRTKEAMFKSGEYEPLPEAKRGVASEYVDEQYELAVRARMASAQLEQNTETLGRLRVQ